MLGDKEMPPSRWGKVSVCGDVGSMMGGGEREIREIEKSTRA